ncbi:methyltransferase domain-domain-containing protein [Coniella lustricola]|uniref:Methyltransferase domain-domain-containing protein n=1 Tax=Coniella lustricola TaxID=2025994 RepID=A0A2T3AC45_9PEZI|nr:methyltransferase domain-domain-containing protein [Coniella lustricola]
MPPHKPLPISDEFGTTEEYIKSLLAFVSTSDPFQILCGGVHILDFFTSEPGLFQWVLPEDWQDFLMACDPMALLDLLLRDDLDAPPEARTWPDPPETFRKYIQDVRRHSLSRSFAPVKPRLPVIPRQVAVGMNIKKVHEVTNFADYVDRLAADIEQLAGTEVTHFIDFGSGQNYLGRTLASAPYSKNIVAVEGRENNQEGARALDVFAGLAEPEKVMRNKKVWQSLVDSQTPTEKLDEKAKRRNAERPTQEQLEATDIRPRNVLKTTYRPEEGRGVIKYITGRLETGDMSEVLDKIHDEEIPQDQRKELSLMAISIHSCGNLSHFGIRSMILNPSIKAVAIVGCCYNLLTEKLGPPTYKLPYMRPSLQAINGRVVRESDKHDPQGFPMSQRVSTYDERGIRFNITARMMACQAPQNWTEKESDSFFTRHFYRAVLQKIFLDRGVISKVYHDLGEGGDDKNSPFNMSTNPVIIGSLGKSCYKSFHAYVRGAINKLTTNREYTQYSQVIHDKMAGITDEEIDGYVKAYQGRKRELSAVWTLMAFSAGVVESLIVTDRWLFLKEHANIVQDCWVESVFDYKESPRNLVVVGIKRKDAMAGA